MSRLVIEGYLCSVLTTRLDLAKVIRAYYRQRRDTNSFLHSNHSVSHTTYLRILALASIDILLTLPIGIVNVTLDIVAELDQNIFQFYPGWTFVHTGWEPVARFPYADTTAALAQLYFSYWTTPVLAFVIFGLFGVTSEARKSYWRVIHKMTGLFGWRSSPNAQRRRSFVGEMKFCAPPGQTDMSGLNLEVGCVLIRCCLV